MNTGTKSVEEREYITKRKIASSFNRLKFLNDCILEQVLPKSAPQQLKNKDHPFGASARSYLEEACSQIKDNIYVLREEIQGVQLTNELRTKLNKFNEKQKTKLNHKLKTLCDKSPWKEAGNVEIVTNLSKRPLTNYEKEALALGVKFDTGRDKSHYVDHVRRNYRWNEDDVEKGFIQGVLLCCKALTDQEKDKLPRRYMEAIKKLANDSSVIITQADKGGGVVIMDRTDYESKMNELLQDSDTYEKKTPGFIDKLSKKFNKEARKVLKKSDKGKQLTHLLEEAPAPPRMRGLPKLHKANVPMRPITSGIGSAPHRLAKVLARPLSASLGTISDAHLRNTDDLMERIRDVDLTDKFLASFDVKSLFTNVSVEVAFEAIKSVVDKIDPEQLPVPKEDYLKLVSICMSFGGFKFYNEEYFQHSGLAMGSPLSPVAACLYMEWLEKHHYQGIMGQEVIWVRYVDDVLVVVPKSLDLDSKLNELNSVNEKIQFTLEKEDQGSIGFLDTMLIRNDRAKFKVYRKPTNKESYVHFYSGHSDRVKSGVVLGFFLRAFRICSPEYIEDEVEHIMSSFAKLKYPKGFLVNLKRKASNIRKRSPTAKTKNKDERYITIPNSKAAVTIAKQLETTGFKVAFTSGKRVGDMISEKKGEVQKGNVNSVVYQVPCGSCNRKYIGETGRGMTTRFKEHKRDLRNHMEHSAFVLHAQRTNHLPNWDGAGALAFCNNRENRKATEAAYIATNETINTRAGFMKWAKSAAVFGILNMRR